MWKDKDNIPLNVGDQVLLDGCLYIVREFLVYELAVEVVCEDKLTHNLKAFQPRDLIKI